MRKEACKAGKFPLGLRGTGIDNTLAGLLACRAATLAEAACFLFTGQFWTCSPGKFADWRLQQTDVTSC